MPFKVNSINWKILFSFGIISVDKFKFENNTNAQPGDGEGAESHLKLI